MRGPNQVLSTREAQLSLTDPKFEAAEPDKTPPLAVQKIGSQQALSLRQRQKHEKCCGRKAFA